MIAKESDGPTITLEATSDNKRNTLWLLRVRELSETDQQNMDTRSSNQ